MAFELIDEPFPGLAASSIQDRQVVGLTTSERGVVPLATVGLEPHGIEVRGASAAQGEGVSIADMGNYAKAWAAASLGAGTDVGIVGATRSLGPITGASGTLKYRVGRSVNAAAAGEVFTLYVKPTLISGAP